MAIGLQQAHQRVRQMPPHQRVHRHLVLMGVETEAVADGVVVVLVVAEGVVVEDSMVKVRSGIEAVQCFFWFAVFNKTEI